MTRCRILKHQKRFCPHHERGTPLSFASVEYLTSYGSLYRAVEQSLCRRFTSSVALHILPVLMISLPATFVRSSFAYALTNDTFSAMFLTKHYLYHVFMQQRYLSALTGIGVVLVGGIFLVWSKRMESEPHQNQMPKEEVVETPTTESLDRSDWKTYRNETYGFMVRYPAAWSAKEFYSAGFGMPVDCQKMQKSRDCPNFGVAFSPTSHDDLEANPVVLNTFSQEANTGVTNDDRTKETLPNETPPWKKTTDVGDEYFKNNSYFPLYASCWNQASIPRISLKGGVGFYFSIFYEVPGDIYMDAADEFCSQEIPDLIFDAIVESFRPI